MTRMININTLASRPKVVIHLDGVPHEVKEPTVQDTIDFALAVEKLGDSRSIAGDMELMVSVLSRSLPSVPEETVRGWPASVLKEVFDAAREMDTLEVVDEGNEKAGS